MKDYIRRILIVIFGAFVMGTGIVLFINSGFGGDPLSVFNQGLALKIKLPLGTVAQIVNISIIFIVFLIDRSHVGIGSVINAITVGMFINLLINVPLLKPQSFGTSIVGLLIGVVLLGVGIGIYLTAELGEGSIEGLMMILNERTKIDIKWIRIAIDTILTITGYFLGGTFGVGTIAGALCTGPITEFTLKSLKVNH